MWTGIIFLPWLLANLYFSEQLAPSNAFFRGGGGFTESEFLPRALVMVQHLNPKLQHQSCGVEMCPKKAMQATVAMLPLYLPGIVIIFFTEIMGCSCPMYLLSLKTNTKYLALDILLNQITTATPHPGWRPRDALSWKICFPDYFIVGA